MFKNSFLGILSFFVLVFHQLAEEHTGFENHAVGTPYTEEAWEKDGFEVALTQSMDKNSVTDDAHAFEGKQSLRMTYPKGKFGPDQNGGQAKLMLQPRSEYYASYRLRFSENFSWGGKDQGGKLPGLAGGENCSGGQKCDGTNGFSARYMWRKGGKAVLYLYHMDKPHKWGDDRELKFPDGTEVFFPKGEWIKLTERVKVNTISNGKANKDGEVQVWFNGKEVLNLKGLRLVSNETQVDNFYFSTFHGGNTKEWAPKNTCWIWYDDLIVSARKEDVF